MWKIVLTDEVAAWLRALDQPTQKKVRNAVAKLSEDGPTLGRPLVDTVRDSKLNNLKELRPITKHTNAVRILFVFDPKRQAVLLVAGDKSGQWNRWYPKAIKVAETRYRRWLDEPQ